MDEKTILEASLLLRECRTLGYRVRDVLEEVYLSNTRCSFSRRLETRVLLERLTNSTEALAEVFQLPPYGAKLSAGENLLHRRTRRGRKPRGVTLQARDARSE